MIEGRRVRMIEHNLRHPGLEGMVKGRNWKGR